MSESWSQKIDDLSTQEGRRDGEESRRHVQLRLCRPSRRRATNGMASDIPSSMVRGLRAIRHREGSPSGETWQRSCPLSLPEWNSSPSQHPEILLEHSGTRHGHGGNPRVRQNIQISGGKTRAAFYLEPGRTPWKWYALAFSSTRLAKKALQLRRRRSYDVP